MQRQFERRFSSRPLDQPRSIGRCQTIHFNVIGWFIRLVKHINNCKPSLPYTVDGVSGASAINELWRRHYSKLFNCVQTNGYQVANVENIDMITTHEVSQAIKNISDNKTTGMDYISAEHLKFASSRLCTLLALCFNALIVHGFLPDSMMTVQLVPLVKDKAGTVGVEGVCGVCVVDGWVTASPGLSQTDWALAGWGCTPVVHESNHGTQDKPAINTHSRCHSHDRCTISSANTTSLKLQ